MSLHALANDMASKGRYGDSMLVHMAPNEVAGLHALALRHGEKLTINPQTGLPEAFKLKSLLPMILGAALAPLTAGTSLAFLGATPFAAALTVGAGYGLAKGSLKEGLLAGLGAYGGAGLAASLGSAGVSEAAAQEAFKQSGTAVADEAAAVAAQNAASQSGTAVANDAAAVAADNAARSAAESAYPVAEGVVVDPVHTYTQMPAQGAPVDSASLSTAGYTPTPPPTGLEALKQGAQSIYDKGQVGDFFTNKANRGFTMAAASSALMSPEDEESAPETKRSTGYIRPARYDWRTGKYQYFEPVKASEWGTRNLSEYTNPNDPNARTPFGAKAGGLMALANGGAIAFDGGGGVTDEELRQQAAASEAYYEALRQAQAQSVPAPQPDYYADQQREERYTPPSAPVATTPAPVATTPAADTSGFTVGPTQIGPGPDTSYQMAGGTKAEGYSRDYTPEQRIGINEAFIRSQEDAGYGIKGLMADMEKTGVTAKDLALSRGLDKNTVNQYLVRGGADLDFMGIDTGMDKAKLDAFIKEQNAAPNPYGQGTLGDVFKKQGISDTDPRRYAQAQEVVEREARRNLMRTNAPPTPNRPPEVYVPPPGPPVAPPTPNRPPEVYVPPPSGPVVPPPVYGGVLPPGPVTTPPDLYGTPPGPPRPDVYTPPTGPYNAPLPMPNTPTLESSTMDGSRAAYEYLSGKRVYPTDPYLPIDPVTGKRVIAKSIFDTPGFEALRPKAPVSLYSKDKDKPPTGSPGENMEWKWETDKWVAKPKVLSGTTPGTNLTDINKMPTENPGSGMEWAWDGNKWVPQPVVGTAANGGLMPRRMALGGLGALAGGGSASQYNLGGYSDGGRLLRGPGDGISDSIPATIGNKQPARLADGEFVVPARIVSELGNGSTEAGARKLYAMMDRVQRARGKTTGKNRVAANSRADKYLPA